MLVIPKQEDECSKGKRHGEIQCGRNTNTDKIKTRRRTDNFWGLTQKKKHTRTQYRLQEFNVKDIKDKITAPRKTKGSRETHQ